MRSCKISDQDIYYIFSNIKQIEEFQVTFYEDLKKNQKDVASVFLKWAKKFSVFTPYCTNHDKAGEKLQEIKNKLKDVPLTLEPDFALPSYMLKPVQRICKYPLLLKELSKCTTADSDDYKEITKALTEMKTITIFINELKRRREAMQIVAELEKRIENWKGCDLRCYGVLLLDDTLILVNAGNKQMHFFLFERLLLYATEKKDNVYQMKGKIQLKDSIAQLEKFTVKNGFSFKLIRKDDPTKYIEVKTKNLKQYESWTKEIQQIIDKNLEPIITEAKGDVKTVSRPVSMVLSHQTHINSSFNITSEQQQQQSPIAILKDSNKLNDPMIEKEGSVLNPNSSTHSNPSSNLNVNTNLAVVRIESEPNPSYLPSPSPSPSIANSHNNFKQSLSITSLQEAELEDQDDSLSRRAKTQSTVTFSKQTSCLFCQEIVNMKLEYISYGGYKWHKEHFNCCQCNKSLSSLPFYLQDERLYCENHYHETFAPRCSACGEIIEDEFIEHIGEMWHIDHFCCANCDETLIDKVFYEVDGQAYCEKDYHNLFGTKCFICSEPIQDNGLVYNGNHYHNECFRCKECDKILNGQFYPLEGEAYCEEHFQLKTCIHCSFCSKPINDSYITYADLPYHENCFDTYESQNNLK